MIGQQLAADLAEALDAIGPTRCDRRVRETAAQLSCPADELEQTIRLVLVNSRAFHAAGWESREIISAAWLTLLGRRITGVETDDARIAVLQLAVEMLDEDG